MFSRRHSLADAINSLHTVMPWFRKKYNVEKLNVIVLSDGEAGAGVSLAIVQAFCDAIVMLFALLKIVQTRNRKRGIVYKPFQEGYLGNMKIILTMLEPFPESNIVCFRLIEGRMLLPGSVLLGTSVSTTLRSSKQQEKTMVVVKVLVTMLSI